MSAYLTTREFDTWRAGHDAKINDLLELARTGQDAHHAMDVRLTRVEEAQKHSEQRTATRASLISSVVGGVVGGVTGWWSRG